MKMILNEITFYLLLIVSCGMFAELMNGIDWILKNCFPLKEAIDKPLPPKYIVKELTYHD